MNHSGWWAFGRTQNIDQFEQPKVMLPDYNDRPSAAFDHDGQFYSITAYCLTLRPGAPLSLSSLTCLLNSRLLFWVLAKTGTALQRGFVRFMPQYMLELPIAIPDGPQRTQLESLHKQAVEGGYDAIATDLDVAVCRLYGVADLEKLFSEPKGE
jgi:restriction endonuclease TaqI-like protein